MNLHKIYINKLTTTIDAPVGSANTNERHNPIIKQMTPIHPDTITTFLYVLHTNIDVKHGKIVSDAINKDPIIRIPNTTVIEHNIAIIILYNETLIPVLFAKSLSNVKAKIR